MDMKDQSVQSNISCGKPCIPNYFSDLKSIVKYIVDDPLPRDISYKEILLYYKNDIALENFVNMAQYPNL